MGYSTPTTPRSQFVTSSDGTLVYADCIGDPENPSIVFLHGITYSTVAFDCIFLNPTYSEKYFLVRMLHNLTPPIRNPKHRHATG